MVSSLCSVKVYERAMYLNNLLTEIMPLSIPTESLRVSGLKDMHAHGAANTDAHNHGYARSVHANTPAHTDICLLVFLQYFTYTLQLEIKKNTRSVSSRAQLKPHIYPVHHNTMV